MQLSGRKHFSILFEIEYLVLMLFTVMLLGAAEVSASSADALWPEFTGEGVVVDGSLMLDYSHAANGYVICGTAAPSGNELKLRVTFGDKQLTYDLDAQGRTEIFPLQLGSGYYAFDLYENVGGSKYAGAGQVGLDVQLESETAAFLVPNQYVYYTRESPSVKKSDEISSGSQSEIYQSVCDFMASEFSYDFVRAQTIAPGSLPEVDSCYEMRSGICQDLAAVMVSMLRVQGIPSKLVIGYADGYYHAWTSSIVDGEEKFFDPTVAVDALRASNYSTERFY
jgi:hypothetical protein